MSDRADVEFVSRVLENTRGGVLRWERWDQPWSKYGATLPTGQMLTLDRRFLDDPTVYDLGPPDSEHATVLELHKETGEAVYTFVSGPDPHGLCLTDAEVSRLVDVLWDLVGKRDRNDELAKAFSGLDELARDTGTR